MPSLGSAQGIFNENSRPIISNAQAVELTMAGVVGSGREFEAAKAEARESLPPVLNGGGDEAKSQALEDLSAAFVVAGDDKKAARFKARDALANMLSSAQLRSSAGTDASVLSPSAEQPRKIKP